MPISTTYTQTTYFQPKDNYTPGNSDKIIYGAEVDPELLAISNAIAVKYDAGWSADNAGLIDDLHDLTDPGADRIFFWDDSASAGTWLTLSDGLQIVATDISIDINGLTTQSGLDATADYIAMYDTDAGAPRKVLIDDLIASSSNAVPESRQVIAGTSLTGGGALSSNVTLNVDETSIDHDALTNFVADEHVAHGSVSITAGSGLTGGGTIASTRTLDIDLSSLSDLTGWTLADGVAIWDDSASVLRNVPLSTFFKDYVDNTISHQPSIDKTWTTSTTLADIVDFMPNVTGMESGEQYVVEFDLFMNAGDAVTDLDLSITADSGLITDLRMFSVSDAGAVASTYVLGIVGSTRRTIALASGNSVVKGFFRVSGAADGEYVTVQASASNSSANTLTLQDTSTFRITKIQNKST